MKWNSFDCHFDPVRLDKCKSHVHRDAKCAPTKKLLEGAFILFLKPAKSIEVFNPTLKYLTLINLWNGAFSEIVKDGKYCLSGVFQPRVYFPQRSVTNFRSNILQS